MMLVIITIFTIVILILIAIITHVSVGTTYQLINRRKDKGQQWVLCTSTLECDSILLGNTIPTLRMGERAVPCKLLVRKMIHTTLKESMW